MRTYAFSNPAGVCCVISVLQAHGAPPLDGTERATPGGSFVNRRVAENFPRPCFFAFL
jgi:hypothetical protein